MLVLTSAYIESEPVSNIESTRLIKSARLLEQSEKYSCFTVKSEIFSRISFQYLIPQ